VAVASWRPDLAVQVAFDALPNDPAAVPTWTDLSSMFTAAGGVRRGQQYELQTNLGSRPTVSFIDRNEYLNPTNTNSPYSPNVQVYRQLLWQAMWPNAGTGNLLNSNTQGGAIDGSFEAYSNGQALPWATGIGGRTVTASTTTPFAGTKCLTTDTLTAGATVQGIALGPFATIPGRLYTAQAQVRPGGAFTVAIAIDNAPVLNTNPYLDAALTDWVGQNSTLTLSALYPYSGTTSMLITPNGSTSGGAITSTHYPVLTGLSYTAKAWVYIPTGWSDMRTCIDWYDSGNTFLSTSLGSATAVPANTWAQLSQTLTAPASAAFAVLRVRWGSTPPSTLAIYTDAITLQPAAGLYQGATTSVSSTYARLTVSFIATQPTHSIRVQTSGTVTATTVKVDNLQLEPGGSASTFTTTGPTVYGVFRGYMERWPAEWVPDTQGFLGLCQGTAVDSFTPLNNIALSTEIRNSIFAKNPAYYWTLAEPSGSTIFGESSGNNGPPLVPANSKTGAGPTFVAGAATNIAGDPGGTGLSDNTGAVTAAVPTTVAQTGTANNTPKLTGLGGTTPPWGYSLAMWVSRSAPISTHAQFMVAVFIPTGFRANDLFSTQASPNLLTTSAEWANGSGAGFFFTDNWADGQPHLYAWTVATTPTTWTYSVYVDGVLISSPTVAYDGTPWTPTGIQVGGMFDPTTLVGSMSAPDGVYAHIALFNRALSAGEITDLANAGQGYSGETSGQRVARYLSYRWNGLTAIDTGQSVMGVSPLTDGTAALAAIQSGPVTTENGNFWPDSRGYTTFSSRTRQYLTTTSSYTFGENVAGGEYPYQEGAVFGFDPQLLYDTVSITNQPTGPNVTVTDPAAVDAFFPQNYRRALNVQDPNEVYDAANYVLNQYGQPRQRVASIVLNPMAYPALWPVVLGIEVGVRVTVKRRPKAANSGTGFTMSQDYFILNISHDRINLDPEQEQWETTLLLAPVDLYQVGILNDSTYGLLDSTMVLAY
jgi:hypothetical protein